MKSKDNLKAIFEYCQTLDENPVQFDKEAISKAYHKDERQHSLPIKVLSVFGGILASLMFLGFLLFGGLYDSVVGLLTFGGICFIGSIWINKEFDKVTADTVSVMLFIVGFVLIGFGCEKLNVDEDVLSMLFIVIAIGALIIVQGYMLAFIAVLIINGSILTLIISNGYDDLVNIYVVLLALTMTYLFLKEAKLVTAHKKISRLYNPVRIGVVFSFLSGLVLLGKKGILSLATDYIWLSSVAIIALMLYLVSILYKTIDISEKRYQIRSYILIVFALAPTVLSPAISGALLIILLGFLVNHRTTFVLGIISFIYFISQYYYDLNFTLLTKSILLFATGVFFLVLYLFTTKKLKTDEEL